LVCASRSTTVRGGVAQFFSRKICVTTNDKGYNKLE